MIGTREEPVARNDCIFSVISDRFGNALWLPPAALDPVGDEGVLDASIIIGVDKAASLG